MRGLLAALVSMALAMPAMAAPKAKAEKKGDDPRGFGVGGGLFILFPPMLTAQGSWQINRYANVGAEVGYLTVPVQKFQGTSSYVGLDGKGFIGTTGIFGGLAVGRRTFHIVTHNDLAVNEVVNDVAWTRDVSQTILYPKAGWMRIMKGGHAVVLAAGLVVPTGTSFTISHDPETIQGGLSEEDLQSEEDKRAEDVTSVTNAKMLSVEVKYQFYFDAR